MYFPSAPYLSFSFHAFPAQYKSFDIESDIIFFLFADNEMDVELQLGVGDDDSVGVDDGEEGVIDVTVAENAEECVVRDEQVGSGVNLVCETDDQEYLDSEYGE